MKTKQNKNLLVIGVVLIACFIVIGFSRSIQGRDRSYEIKPEIRLPQYRTDTGRAIDAYERVMDRFMSLTEENLTSVNTDVKDIAKKLVLIDCKLTDISIRMGRIEKFIGIEHSVKPVEKSSKDESDSPELTEDRFDHLIRNCVILDVEGEKSAEEIFRRVSDILAERLKTNGGVLFEKFLRREAGGSTVVQSGFAIPHIVIEGEDKFDVLLIRARDGINFPHAQDPVRIMFILAGSKDQRNYHLRALMAIAQTAQEKDFEKRWWAARDTEAIKNLILLSARKRDIGA